MGPDDRDANYVREVQKSSIFSTNSCLVVRLRVMPSSVVGVDRVDELVPCLTGPSAFGIFSERLMGVVGEVHHRADGR